MKKFTFVSCPSEFDQISVFKENKTTLNTLYQLRMKLKVNINLIF